MTTNPPLPPAVAMPPRTLSALLSGISHTRVHVVNDISITDVVFDSRLATAGSLFVALRGGYADGHQFVAQAAARGAVAVLAEQALEPPPGMRAVVVVPDTRAALAQVAANWYLHPANDLTVIGVTGTNGKTTTTAMIGSVLDAGRLRNATLGTVEMKLGAERWSNPNHQTTPESLHVQQFLRQAVVAGCTHAVLEATSHALAMHRLDAMPVDVAVLTNLSHDHLDYHGTFERYRDAKRLLFTRLDAYPERQRPRVAVVNTDDANAPAFLDATQHASALTYGLNADAAVRATEIAERDRGTTFTLHIHRDTNDVQINTLGTYNVQNALAAAAVGHAQGIDAAAIVAGLGAWHDVAGHLEYVDCAQPFRVVVDFAHTPVAFAALLDLLRRTTRGRLIAVFGSAGERDLAKRALQGEIAARVADVSYLTNEDPRFEDAEAILRAIAAGGTRHGWREGHDYFTIADRRAAIFAAIAAARPGDTVALIGKGHENSIIVGAEAVPWDEATVAREALHACGFYAEGSDE